MNEKFYNLSEEKQNRIINAGYRVFSQSSYKKSSMSEIADYAGISKSLLFFYFRNKKEFYIFLWDKAVEVTLKSMTLQNCYESEDLFDMMERGMMAKISLMKQYPYMSMFAIKAFYEKDEAVCSEIQKSYREALDFKATDTLSAIKPNYFVEGIDLKLMYREMYLAAEGYLWEATQRGELDVKVLERDFRELLDFWKSIYKKKGE